jgi:hypothetical protein
MLGFGDTWRDTYPTTPLTQLDTRETVLRGKEIVSYG